MNIRKIPEGEIPLSGGFHKMSMIIRGKMRERLDKEKAIPKQFKPPCIGLIHGIGLMSPVSQKELSNWMGVDPSDAVSMIDQLETSGHVLRTRDVNDRRKQLLSLTKKGEELRKKLSIIANDVIDETFAPLNEKELETFRKLLERVIRYNHEEKSK